MSFFERFVHPAVSIDRFDPEEIRFWLFEGGAGGVIVQEKLPQELSRTLGTLSEEEVFSLRKKFARHKDSTRGTGQGGALDQIEEVMDTDLQRLRLVSGEEIAGIVLSFDERTSLPPHIDQTIGKQVLLHRHFDGCGLIVISPHQRTKVEIDAWAHDLYIKKKSLDALTKSGALSIELKPGESLYFNNTLAHRSNPNNARSIRALTL